MAETKVVINPILQIPEPRNTIGLNHSDISKLIKKHYKPVSKSGKEQNLISGYTNAVRTKLFSYYKPGDTLIFKFSHIRYDWIIAVIKYFDKNTQVTEVDGGILCKPIKN